MKRKTDKNIEFALLEQRVINEEYANAMLKKQLTFATMRESKIATNSDKNGGVL